MRILTSPKNPLIPEHTSIQILLLIFFGVIMCCIRTIPIYDTIFTNWPSDYGKFVNFASDDAVYHMRLVHNTIHHFPWRIFFDPFTHIPFGNQIHFGPLFTLIIASISLLIGCGHPTPDLINAVGAYTPVIMGALCLLPIYFIAKKLFGKTAAIITAFIFTFLPGEFLQRSSLGFTDHHVAETLFSTITCAFLIYALNTANTLNCSLKNLCWQSHRIAIMYSLLAGISFGLFVLVWPAALMFGAIFLLFFIIQLLIDHFHNRRTEYLLLLTIIIYTAPTLMVLPYAIINAKLELTYYSLTQPLMLISMLSVFVICYMIHLVFKRSKLTKDLYSIALAAIFILTIFIVHRYTPQLYAVIKDGCKLLFEPTEGMRTISEIRPSLIDLTGNSFTLAIFWRTYVLAAPLALIGFGVLSYRAHKYLHPTEIFLLTWSTAILLTACAQCRFNYYFAINVATLAGCYCIYPSINLSLNSPNKTIPLILRKAFICAACAGFAAFMLHSIYQNILSNLQITREKYNTFIWLKHHTPDPQGKIIHKNFSYASGYYPIPKNPKFTYPYPDSAYGIMAWWDIGHQITYIAERIPNANPFQLGIIESNNKIGAAPFFTSLDEETAVKNLDHTKSRYILIDYQTAFNIKGIGIWCHDTDNWTTNIKIQTILPEEKLALEVPVDSKKFSRSIMNRLFYNDADGLQHFRLIHESDGDYHVALRQAAFKPNFSTNQTTLHLKNFSENAINPPFWTNKEKTVLTYQSRPPVKKLKVYEKVKGATIIGKVPTNIADNTHAELILKLKTKYNRIFVYRQTTKIIRGQYEFIVPYPTTAMSSDDYHYDIQAIGNYKVKIGNKEREISVPETAIMLGQIINVPK